MAEVVAYLFFPLTTSSHSMNSSSSSSSSSDYSVWVWMTLGLVGYKLCTSAIELYEFCEVWHRVTQTHQVDVNILRLSKERIERRQLQIDQALHTVRFPSQNEGPEPNKNDDDHGETETSKQHDSAGRPDDVHYYNSNDESSFGSVAPSCPICLGAFQPKDLSSCSSSTHSTACRHRFHTTCLKTWLFKHSSCPVCRFEMLPPPSASMVLTGLLTEVHGYRATTPATTPLGTGRVRIAAEAVSAS